LAASGHFVQLLIDKRQSTKKGQGDGAWHGFDAGKMPIIPVSSCAGLVFRRFY